MAGYRVRCQCGRWLEVDESEFGRTSICPHCGQSVIVVRPETPESPTEPPAEEQPSDTLSPIPWLWRRQLGTARAAWRTIKLVLGEPRYTFQVAPHGNILQNAGFLLLMTAIIFGLNFVVNMPSFRMIPGFPESTGARLSLGLFAIALLVGIVLAAVAVNSAVMHYLLRLFNAAREGLGATFRVNLYTAGAAMPFLLLPVIGAFIALGWWAVSTIKGLGALHRAETRPVALAVLIAAGIPFTALTFLLAAAFAAGRMNFMK